MAESFMTGPEHEETDIVIVGAGSAGCVLASRLSVRRDLNVTVLEAGGSDRSLWVRMPIGYGGAFHHPRLNWRYMTEPDPGLGGRAAYWPRGKVIGGSSSINAMVFIRGQARDYDAWAEAGNTGWSYQDLLPAFRRLEDNLAGSDTYRAAGGPITITDIAAHAHSLGHAFLDAARRAGFRDNADFNGADQEGVGFYQITTRRGLRCSAATGYLRPALKRSNLRLETEAHVTRILFKGHRAVGVEYRKGDRLVSLRARREVILSAGAIGSPQILQLSGIGDPERLSALGIETVLARPQVGRNLQDHVGFDFVYEATVPTLNSVLGPLMARGMAGLRYVATRGGPLSLSVNQAGGFVRSGPGRDRPNLQLYFSPLSYTRAVPGKRRLTKPDSFPGFMMGLSNCHPRSRGWLHVRSADPAEPPEIHPRYYAEPEDMEEMLEGTEILRRIAAEAPVAGVVREEKLPGAGVTGREDMADYIRARSGSVFHPCGTCAMGPDPATSVVDPELRVHGIAGLRVADASIMPTIPAGNLGAPCLMIGERAAELIRAVN
ncbi:GMC family oxidoreductase N-terminal domain-containing protein [Roseicyclus sp. F158]|uniref:GMC family oxidoreductase N-terminal domain-containing protein n=1 Tax=Tropicimonas omnivorans TaxID=3075590 RepID=A0ABU3DGX3_9RHOB|nr:GMC family oxidoreductase N-terminal domain-containing protein [Roseicyclus sp. F158]MDT0682958.1 GMC family oxidoreductase N-terminal domain-containing protein [Roseicyclus sp. F158]